MEPGQRVNWFEGIYDIVYKLNIYMCISMCVNVFIDRKTKTKKQRAVNTQTNIGV